MALNKGHARRWHDGRGGAQSLLVNGWCVLAFSSRFQIVWLALARNPLGEDGVPVKRLVGLTAADHFSGHFRSTCSI